MADSAVEICNMALAAIGETTFIESLDLTTDQRPEAEVCNRFYSKTVREALESAEWPFATKEASLAVATGSTRVGWDYIYTLPTDCARPLALLADGERIGLLTSDDKQARPFDVVLDDNGQGKVLCTDLDASNGDFDVLQYVAYVEFVPMFPELFVEAVVLKLASWCALALKKDVSLGFEFRARYAAALPMAVGAQFEGMQADPELDTSTLNAR